MLALEKELHVAMEMLVLRHHSFGQKIPARLGHGAIHRSQTPGEKPGQSHFTCLGDSEWRGSKVKCFPPSEEALSDRTFYSHQKPY